MGKWMSRLETSKSPGDAPAKTTKTPEMRSDRVSVVSVAPPTGNFQKSGGWNVAVQAQPHKAERPTPVMHEAPPTPGPASVLGANGELDRLLAAAMRCCDYWNDGQAARAEMVADIKATPQDLRQDLLEHFLTTYGKSQ